MATENSISTRYPYKSEYRTGTEYHTGTRYDRNMENVVGLEEGRAAGERAGLRDRMRQKMRVEVGAVACRLFAEQGFAKTTVDQIAAQAGLSRTSVFRYFGTKEDIALVSMENWGDLIALNLADRPEDEPPWHALRRCFDVMVNARDDARDTELPYWRMLCETPELKTRYWDRQLGWQDALSPEIARRYPAFPPHETELKARALVSSALVCVGIATDAWLSCDGETPMSDLLDSAMSALIPLCPSESMPRMG
jgi:AcrR family transcriptional regulator